MLDKDGFWYVKDSDKNVHKRCIGCIWVAKIDKFYNESKCSRGFMPQFVWAGKKGLCKFKQFDFKIAMEHRTNNEYNV